MKGTILQQTKESKPMKYERTRCSNDGYIYKTKECLIKVNVGGCTPQNKRSYLGIP